MPILGADATHPATESLIKTAAAALHVEKPAFFGRYFKGPHNQNPIQYQPAIENPVLHKLDIRVLCIARQTNRVGGSMSDGVADATKNASAIATAFGPDHLGSLGFAPIVFLDTEPQQPLSADYFVGWSHGMIDQGPQLGATHLRFTPAVYLNKGDVPTWNALRAAMGRDAKCAAAWVANYGHRTGAEGPPAWSDGEVSPKPPAPCPISAWQYAGDYDEVLDFSILSPAGGASILALMVPPPP